MTSGRMSCMETQEEGRASPRTPSPVVDDQHPFSRNLVRLLTGSGKTSRELAHYLECSEAQVSKWRNGKHIPIYARQRKIAQYFGVPLEELWRDR